MACLADFPWRSAFFIVDKLPVSRSSARWMLIDANTRINVELELLGLEKFIYAVVLSSIM